MSSTAPLPASGEHGTLITASGLRWPVRVASQSGSTITLVRVVPGREPLEEGVLENVVLETTSARGLVRLEGEATAPEDDLLSFRILDIRDVLQRRDFVRVQAPRPVALVLDSERNEIATYSVDLSGNGMLLAGPDVLSVGDRVGYRLRFDPDQAPIEGAGRVVRVGDAGHRAIAFEDLASADRERLIRFIFERQRVARRTTRDREA